MLQNRSLRLSWATLHRVAGSFQRHFQFAIIVKSQLLDHFLTIGKQQQLSSLRDGSGFPSTIVHHTDLVLVHGSDLNRPVGSLANLVEEHFPHLKSPSWQRSSPGLKQLARPLVTSVAYGGTHRLPVW